MSRSSHPEGWQMDKLLVVLCCGRKFCWHGFGFTCPLRGKKKNRVHPSGTVSETSIPRHIEAALVASHGQRHFMLFFPSICHHLYSIFHIWSHAGVDTYHQDDSPPFTLFPNILFLLLIIAMYCILCNLQYNLEYDKCYNTKRQT